MKNWHLLTISVLSALIGCEIIARVYIKYAWPKDRIYTYTHHTAEKGRYSSHPYLPYILRPAHNTLNNKYHHNSYGFRGKEFEIEKPAGMFRIVAIGASTTYGVATMDSETYPAQLEQIMKNNGMDNVEVLNAGVTGYNSTEIFINYYLRVINLDPDMIIFYQARNEVFPQAFNNFTPDYSHFREPDYTFKYSNYFHKYLFKFSHLFMLFSTRGDGYFGWSQQNENPHYGSIRYTNKPANAEVMRNLSKPQRLDTYRKNVESIILLSLRNNIHVVLSTYAFLKEKYKSGVIVRDGTILPVIEKQISKNNNIVRKLAKKYDVTFIDTANELSNKLEEYLVDGCHFNKEGQWARANLLFDHIKTYIKIKNTSSSTSLEN